MAQGIDTLIENSNYNGVLFTKTAEFDNLSRNAVIPEGLQEWRGKKPAELDFKPFWIPAGLVVLAAGWFGATAVFLMRANGLYTRFFLDYLDLETMEPDVKYVAKVSRLEDLEGKKGLTWQVILAGLGLAGVFGFAFGGRAGDPWARASYWAWAGWLVGSRPAWLDTSGCCSRPSRTAWRGSARSCSAAISAGWRTFSSARWPSCSRRSCRSFTAE